MPANIEHHVFKQPSNPDIKIWRYMDFTKYVALLDSGSLYFPRSDKLGDPLEGSTSKANVRLRPHVYKDWSKELLEKHLLQMEAYGRWVRQWTFISCWHLNERESAAMWGLYARTNEAIAVQSTYARLRDCLPSEADAYMGEVRYMDYDTEWLPEGNTFAPFVHKRKSFEHEREIRAVIQDWPTRPSEEGTGGVTDVGKLNAEAGRHIEVPINDLLVAVYVAPTAPVWFRDLVGAVTQRYGFQDKPIIRSSLDEGPVY